MSLIGTFETCRMRRANVRGQSGRGIKWPPWRPPPAKIEKKPAKSRHRVEKIGDGLSHGHDAQSAINVTASCK